MAEKAKAKIDVSPTAQNIPASAEKEKLIAHIEKYKIANPVRYERVKGELEAQLAKL